MEQACRYGSLGFRGLKIGTGFDGRPGGYTTTPGTPPYGTWYAGSTAGRVADERAKFGALREALGPDMELATDCHAVQVREPWSRSTAFDLARALEQDEGQKLGGKSAEAARFILRAIARELDNA